MYVPFLSLALTSVALSSGFSAWLLPMVVYYVSMSLYVLTGRAEQNFMEFVHTENDRLKFNFFQLCCVIIPAFAYSYLFLNTSPIFAAVNLCFVVPHTFLMLKTKKLLASGAEKFYSASRSR